MGDHCINVAGICNFSGVKYAYLDEWIWKGGLFNILNGDDDVEAFSIIEWQFQVWEREILAVRLS